MARAAPQPKRIAPCLRWTFALIASFSAAEIRSARDKTTTPARRSERDRFAQQAPGKEMPQTKRLEGVDQDQIESRANRRC